MVFTTSMGFLAMMGTLLGEDQPECDRSGHFKVFHRGALAAGRADVGR